jgi:hypothetical protein
MTTVPTVPENSAPPQADPERVVLDGRTDWRNPDIRYRELNESRGIVIPYGPDKIDRFRS